MVPSDAVELRSGSHVLLIGRRLSFGQLSRLGPRIPGLVDDPHRLTGLLRRYFLDPGNAGKLRAFWWRVSGGMNIPWNDRDLVMDIARRVSQGMWIALEIRKERRGTGTLEQERRQAGIRPVALGPASGEIRSLSLEEKFALTLQKVPDHLEDSVRDSFRSLMTPEAIGFTVATTVAIAGVTVATGGAAVPVIIAVGYALAGWAIFNAVGDLIDTFKLVHDAMDEGDLDRAAARLASAVAELTVGVLIALLTRGAGRLGVGGKSRARTNQTNEFETAPPHQDRLEAPRDVEPTRSVQEGAEQSTFTPSGKTFLPEGPVHVSDAHRVNTITVSTRFGGGNRNTPKTVARGDIDLDADIAEINAGQAKLLENGHVQTSSGRIFGTHSDGRSAIYPISGPGLVNLSQAEFNIFRQMTRSGGLKDHALRAFDGMVKSGNSGLDTTSKRRLIDLFESRK